jgi:stage V sporulation protein G
MDITDVKVRKLFSDDGKNKVLAIVSIVIDGGFAVHDLKVIKGVERIFVAMPNRRSVDGRFQDIVHPISKETREKLEETVLKEYCAAVDEAKAESAAG